MPSTPKGSTEATTTQALPGGSSNQLILYAILSIVAYYAVQSAYEIRLQAIKEYGPVIHEFDPYFNYRATEYLYYNGWRRFFTWFDHKVWYPLGRPVGTTIYPGMQFTAVFIKDYIVGDRMSLNDVCCYIPAWFGVLATCITGCIAYWCTKHPAPFSVWGLLKEWMGQTSNASAAANDKRHTTALLSGVLAAAMMSIVPAHLMRSMGGGYDNESVAVSAMVLVFLLWVVCLEFPAVAVLTGLAYWYMVAAWGGYVFCINLIAVHAAALGAVHFTKRLYASYTVFFVVGTFLATRVPVVGMAPLKSLEQLSAVLVFLVYQVFMAVEVFYVDRHTKSNSGRRPGFFATWLVRFQVLAACCAIGLLLGSLVLPAHYFGPLSSRVRGLFVQHTKTGNPLVDSVAEHQPASSRAYFQYLHHVCSLAPMGFLWVATWGLTKTSSFILVWATAAYFFSNKMVRLVLLTAPIASILGGIAAAQLLSWAVAQWMEDEEGGDGTTTTTTTQQQSRKRKPNTSNRRSSNRHQQQHHHNSLQTVQAHLYAFKKSKEGVVMQRIGAAMIVLAGYLATQSFVAYCWRLSLDLSNPSIILKARVRDGRIVQVDDYREAYWWIRDNTPEDARIMAWWDYGYQISAIANRTTLADGNTWNHEHIALLGKALTTDLNQGYEIARHLADYVLVWAGGGGDDLAKSPHLARIANSVYRDHCPDGDPTCRAFGFIDRQGTPSTMMQRSFLYQLHGHGLKADAHVPDTQFKEVHRSKYGKVRIFKIIGVDKESKAWVPKHYQCDAAGSWFCPGQYPPGLQEILSQKKDFRQLEDFNRGGSDDSEDEEYQKKYMENIQNPEEAKRRALEKERAAQEKLDSAKSSEEFQRKKALLYSAWEDSEDATRMWQLIQDDNIQELRQWLQAQPEMAFIRSKDGRGPMFWAHEQRNEGVTKLLLQMGVPNTDADANGLTPVDLLRS